MAYIGPFITGLRFVEMDEWFDRQKAHLSILGSQLLDPVKAIAIVSKQRNDLAPLREFAQTSVTGDTETPLTIAHGVGRVRA